MLTGILGSGAIFDLLLKGHQNLYSLFWLEPWTQSEALWHEIAYSQEIALGSRRTIAPKNKDYSFGSRS
jgi:hypothetical protein